VQQIADARNRLHGRRFAIRYDLSFALYVQRGMRRDAQVRV
jgi:hypothetical protein